MKMIYMIDAVQALMVRLGMRPGAIMALGRIKRAAAGRKA